MRKNKSYWKRPQCSKHKILCIGSKWENLSECYSKLRYDKKNRPDNSKLGKHFHKIHIINDNLNVTILQNNIKTAAGLRYHEDEWIGKLKALAPHGLNTETGDNAKIDVKFFLIQQQILS